MTVPILLTLQPVVAASFALACRHGLAGDAPTRAGTGRSALAALCLLEVTLILPASAYLQWLFPAWSWMYLWEPAPPVYVGVALQLPVALLAFLASLAAVRRDRFDVACVPAALGALSLGALGWFAEARLVSVGSFVAFREHLGDLRPLQGSTPGYLLAVIAPLVLAAWAFSLWRLALLDGAARRGRTPTPRADTSAPEISAQLMSVARSAGTRKS